MDNPKFVNHFEWNALYFIFFILPFHLKSLSRSVAETDQGAREMGKKTLIFKPTKCIWNRKQSIPPKYSYQQQQKEQ